MEMEIDLTGNTKDSMWLGNSLAREVFFELVSEIKDADDAFLDSAVQKPSNVPWIVDTSHIAEKVDTNELEVVKMINFLKKDGLLK